MKEHKGFAHTLKEVLEVCSHYLIEIVIILSLGGCILGGLISDTFSGCAAVVGSFTGNAPADKTDNLHLEGSFQTSPKDAGVAEGDNNDTDPPVRSLP